MKHIITVDVSSEKESEIENLREIFIKDEWDFTETIVKEKKMSIDYESMYIALQDKITDYESEVLSLKEELLEALETATACTENQFSFGDLGFDMRNRAIELRKELGILPKFHIVVEGENRNLKTTPEIELLIIEKLFDEMRYKA